jgi:prophage regulatory protein
MPGTAGSEHQGFLDPRTVCALTTLSRTTLWRRVRDGKFPSPVRISDGRVAWPKAVVEQWLKEKADPQAAAA